MLKRIWLRKFPFGLELIDNVHVFTIIDIKPNYGVNNLTCIYVSMHISIFESKTLLLLFSNL